MRKTEFQQLLIKQHETLLSLTASKGEEYANDDKDQLANFKRQAAELGITQQQVLRVFLTKHLDAITYYCRTGKVLSEEVIGRIDDAVLYLILLKAMRIEETTKPAETPAPKFVPLPPIVMQEARQVTEHLERIAKEAEDAYNGNTAREQRKAFEESVAALDPGVNINVPVAAYVTGTAVEVTGGEWRGYMGVTKTGVNDQGEYLVDFGILYGAKRVKHSYLRPTGGEIVTNSSGETVRLV